MRRLNYLLLAKPANYLGPPQWRGILEEDLRVSRRLIDYFSVDREGSHNGITITTWIQTEPAQQWAVGREFRLRVRRALAEHGIEIGMPRQTYQIESASTEGNDSSQRFLDAG